MVEKKSQESLRGRARARSVPARMAQGKFGVGAWRRRGWCLLRARPLASLRGNVSISSPTLSLPLPLPCPSQKRDTLGLGCSGPQRDAPTALTLPPRLDGRQSEQTTFLPSSLPPSPTDRPSRPLPTLPAPPARALASSPQPSAAQRRAGR